jgi:NTP pyrophosphatase (non-canonical NTP hydrolase)
METDKLITKIILWGRDKHLDDPVMQTCKAVEELGEFCHELTRNHINTVEIQDAIGDILVTIIVLSDILGYNPIACLNLAYNEIKDRKGHTERGTFIKEV